LAITSYRQFRVNHSLVAPSCPICQFPLRGLIPSSSKAHRVACATKKKAELEAKKKADAEAQEAAAKARQAKLDSMLPALNDWECPKCKTMNFKKRNECKSRFCGAIRPDDVPSQVPRPQRNQHQPSPSKTGNPGEASQNSNADNFGLRPGDWRCCGEVVFASRSACRKCGAPKPAPPSNPLDASGIGTSSSAKPPKPGQRGGLRPGDWKCCNEVIFANVLTCRTCCARKPTQTPILEASASVLVPSTAVDPMEVESLKLENQRQADEIARQAAEIVRLTASQNSTPGAVGARGGGPPKNYNQGQQKPRQEGSRGDWTCSCGELVFASRPACRKCGGTRPNPDSNSEVQENNFGDSSRLGASGIRGGKSGVPRDGGKSDGVKEEWTCTSCAFVNVTHPRRKKCNQCGILRK